MYSTSDVRKLKQERDELLEAAKWGRDLLKRLEPGITEENPVYGSLVDAINKAEGRQKFATTNNCREDK